jgi:hypothetical protein
MAPKQMAPNPQSNGAQCVRSGVLAFLSPSALVNPPSSGLWIDQREDGRAVLARPTEWVLRRGGRVRRIHLIDVAFAGTNAPENPIAPKRARERAQLGRNAAKDLARLRLIK